VRRTRGENLPRARASRVHCEFHRKRESQGINRGRESV
jgi:hypothetical protein